MINSLVLMLALAAAPAAPAKDSAPARPAEAVAPKGAKTKKAPAAKPGAKQAQAEKPAEPPPLPPPYKWRVPGLLEWVDSSGVQVSDGVPMILEMALSDRSTQELIQHFANDFQAAGLYIPPDKLQVSPFVEPRLTAFDPERNVAYTVVFQPNPDAKTTTLYLAVADMSGYKPPGAAALTWAPVMPGAQKLLRTEMEGAQTAAYEVSATEAAVLEFYRKEFKALGYRESEPGLFERGGESVRVSSEQKGSERMVSLVRQGGDWGGEKTAAPATP
jgi:hypothetical protein